MTTTRRDVLALAAAALFRPTALKAEAVDQRLASETALFALGKPVEDRAFGLVLAEAVESGYTVPLGIDPAPFLADDPLADVRILAPLNPYPRVATLSFGPMAVGRCNIRIRLARSQTVVALGRTRSGRILRQAAPVTVVIGGCGFDLESPT